MGTLVKLEEVNDYVLLVTLNRPGAANALSLEMLDWIIDTLKVIKQRGKIRAVIITGSGDKAFCAGADLKERAKMSDSHVEETVKKIGKAIQLVEQLPVPTIAAINGIAFGGGLELALACDLRVMNTATRIGLTETSLGIIPGGGGTQRLSRLIGLGRAKEMIFTAKPIDANQAHSIGLVEYIHDSQLLMKEAEDLARSIARNAPIALQQAKKSIHLGFETDLSTGLEIEHSCYKKTILTEDRLEGLRAFKEKREPEYKGR